MAKNKMAICKICGEEIAKSAKACPKCGAKRKRKHIFLYFILAVIVIVIIASLSGNKNEPRLVSESPAGSESLSSESEQSIAAEEAKEELPEEKATFGIGEKVELNNIITTFVGVKESSGSEFNTPSDGNVFVLCEFEIENNSSSEITVSSIMSFTAYCDSYSISEDLGALIEKGSKNQLDGQIASGKKMNGVIGYQVSADWKELEIRFTPDFWVGKEIVFVATR